jgi:hypothetical protein
VTTESWISVNAAIERVGISMRVVFCRPALSMEAAEVFLD